MNILQAYELQYLIEPSGRWIPAWGNEPFGKLTSNRHTIQQLAMRLAIEVFQRQVWVEGGGAKIKVS